MAEQQTPAAIPEAYQKNFQMMLRAARNQDLALVSALTIEGEQAYLVCAMQRNEDDTITPVPFARLIEGNPFELFQDPTQ